MKRMILDSKAFPRIVGIAFALAAISPLLLAWFFPSGPGFFHVRFNAWFVYSLSGVLLLLDGIACWLWYQLRKTSRDLTDLAGQPLGEEIPAVYGHTHLARAEFLALIQILFRRPPDVKYVHVRPLPGGYGGSTTVLAQLQREQSTGPLPRSFVVKLGREREMADEHDKFQEYVQWRLNRAATFFRYAQWKDCAGIAYEFVGLDLDSEIQSFYQFYQGHAAVEVSELIKQIHTHLRQAWYRRGQKVPADLYQEYDLLNEKRELIIGHVGELVDEADPYRANFTAIEERLQPNLRPDFCPPLDHVGWYDPVAFLRTWLRRSLNVPIYRSVVHGDLHARNVLVEIGRDGHKRVWFIDFSHTGNGLSGHRTREAIRRGFPLSPNLGHTLRDFSRLEASVKFVLTRLEDDEDLRRAVAFEDALMSARETPGRSALDNLPAAPPPIEALGDERFQKAWRVVREIRCRAAAYLANADDLRPYYMSLLHATLATVYYHPDQFESEACERQQKRYALISAGMLCARL